MRLVAVAVALAVALGAPSFTAAQSTAAQQQRRDRIKKRIQSLRAGMLIEQLGVEEQLSGKVLAVFAKYDDEFEKLLSARVELNRRINAVTAKDSKAAVEKLIDDTIANQRATWDVEGRRFDELRRLLTPQEAARLLVVLPALERRIQNQLRRAVGVQGGAKPRAEPGRPDFGEDIDDDDDTSDAPVRVPKRKP
jgi:hypothetical protein